MRLTESGFIFLGDILQLESYSYKLKKEFERTPRVLLMLDKHLTSPFYLKNTQSITFFGEKDAIMLAMMSNDLVAYLENFTR